MQNFRNAASQLRVEQSRLFRGERFQNLAKPNLLSGLGWGKSNTTGAKKFDDFNSFVLFSPVDTRC